MVKWIGKFSLLLKRFKDSWMDLLPMSTLGAGQRQNQYKLLETDGMLRQ